MSTPYIGQIQMFSFMIAPKGYAYCNGQLLPINQNQALFAILGTTYGGDGRTTFALPDLRGRGPVHMGNNWILGQRQGETNHTLIISELAQHNHFVNADPTTTATVVAPSASEVLGRANGSSSSMSTFAVSIYGSGGPSNTLNPAAIGNTGGSQPHNNMMPYLTINYCIALTGIFPSQN